MTPGINICFKVCVQFVKYFAADDGDIFFFCERESKTSCCINFCIANIPSSSSTKILVLLMLLWESLSVKFSPQHPYLLPALSQHVIPQIFGDNNPTHNCLSSFQCSKLLSCSVCESMTLLAVLFSFGPALQTQNSSLRASVAPLIPHETLTQLLTIFALLTISGNFIK